MQEWKQTRNFESDKRWSFKR